MEAFLLTKRSADSHRRLSLQSFVRSRQEQTHLLTVIMFGVKHLQTDTDPPVLPSNGAIDNTADYTIIQTQSETDSMGCVSWLGTGNFCPAQITPPTTPSPRCNRRLTRWGSCGWASVIGCRVFCLAANIAAGYTSSRSCCQTM